MMNSLFIADYERFTPNKYRLLPCLIRMVRNHELRFLFWSRQVECRTFLGKTIGSIILRNYRRLYGLEINFKKHRVDAGLRLIHPWNITVNDNAILGQNVTLFKGATIGEIFWGAKKGCPTIGDNVTIYANATVCGNVRIGNNTQIAAGAFVNFDVPQNSVVVGNPGVIHKKNVT